MPVYSTDNSTTSNTTNQDNRGASGAQSRIAGADLQSIDPDASGASAQSTTLQRCTISSGTVQTPDKTNTRSRTPVYATRFGGTVTPSGSPLVICSDGVTYSSKNRWRPPRPWASPIVTDTEVINLSTTSRAKDQQLRVDDDAFGRDLCRPSRRPRRNGVYSYRAHSCFRQLSKTTFIPEELNWVAFYDYRRWRTEPAFPQLVSTGGSVALAASITGVGTVSASLKESHALAAAVTGTSAITAALRETKSFAASVAGTSVVTAALREAKTLAAVITGNSVIQAALSILGGVAGGITASLKRRRRTVGDGSTKHRKRRRW